MPALQAALGRELGTSSERRLAASILAVIAVAGPLVGFVTVALTGLEGADDLPAAIALAVALLLGGALLRHRDRAGWSLLALAVAVGSVLITVVILSVPGHAAAFSAYFVWLAIFSFYFFRPAIAAAEVGWIATLYAFAVADQGGGALERWLPGVLAILGAGLLVLALRHRVARLVASLEEAARTDPLTGLPNRRAFLEQLDRESQRTVRFSSEYALALVDVDGLRRHNDLRGQAEGDRALRQIARLILDTVRVTDWPAHVGGDDFAVILPGVGEPDAVAIAERMRRSVEAETTAADHPLTITVGVAGVYRGRLDAADLLSAADQALQHGKREGGNRVVGSIEISDYVVPRKPPPGSPLIGPQTD